ncbi:Predicted mutarotase [Phaffia rhodozyma]|uniref:Predicted mutarotase n=1 Tax=Phaffia rhodozyma TaxID=264483 RepID=A0A0F7SGX9_PHARH|nr:Predicted mutarotase [Phaffia rhodozyma]
MAPQSTVLSIPSSQLTLSVFHQGLTIHRLLVTELDGAKGGRVNDIIPEVEDWTGKTRDFRHCIVGRYVNRLPAEKPLKLPSGGVATPQTYPASTPGVSLHGGKEGWDLREWQPIETSTSTLFSDAERKVITSETPAPQSQIFTYTSPDGEGGYPGTVKSEVLIALTEESFGKGGVVIVYRAALVGVDDLETPINLTQHWGFNLDISTEKSGSSSIKSHQLTIQSSHTLDLDPKTSLPTGSLVPSDRGTSHDHREGKLIGKSYPEKGYDDFYMFDVNRDFSENPTIFPETGLADVDYLSAVLSTTEPIGSPLVILSSTKSGLSLKFDSNQAGVQLYTAPGGGKGVKRKDLHATEGDQDPDYGLDYGAYLEFHAPYGGFFLPELAKSRWNTILRKGDVYNNFVRMDIGSV